MSAATNPAPVAPSAADATGRTTDMFTTPKVEQTEAYITGRFG